MNMFIDNSKTHKKYNSSEHLIYSCQFHVIFCPKYRRKVLTDEVEVRAKEIFREVSEKYKFDIIEMEIMPDHVHLLIDCNPRFGIMECIKKLKNTSAGLLRTEFPKLRTRIPVMWTRSSFISTLGSVSLDVVKKYIENQKKR